MSPKADTVSSQDIETLELEVAIQAQRATSAAYRKALDVSRRGVLRVEDDQLVRVSRDGTRTIVAAAKPRHKVKIGQVMMVRRIED